MAIDKTVIICSDTDGHSRPGTEEYMDVSKRRTSVPEAVPIGIIDADPEFARHLSRILAERLKDQVFDTESYAGIPSDEDIKGTLPKVVFFDPDFEDFRQVSGAIAKLRDIFGPSVILVVHSDEWGKRFNNVRLDLRDAGIRLGLKRHDYDGAIELISLVSRGASMEALASRFAT